MLTGGLYTMIAKIDSLLLFTLSCLTCYVVWQKFRPIHARLQLRSGKPRKAKERLLHRKAKTAIYSRSGNSELQTLKDVYFKLQNLEEFPQVLPLSRCLLRQMLSGSLLDAAKETHSNILGIDEFTPEKLEEFVHNSEASTKGEWENYLSRRKSGSPESLSRSCC